MHANATSTLIALDFIQDQQQGLRLPLLTPAPTCSSNTQMNLSSAAEASRLPPPLSRGGEKRATLTALKWSVRVASRRGLEGSSCVGGMKWSVRVASRRGLEGSSWGGREEGKKRVWSAGVGRAKGDEQGSSSSENMCANQRWCLGCEVTWRLCMLLCMHGYT